MKVIAIFLGIVVGIVCAAGITIFVIYVKIKKLAKKHGVDKMLTRKNGVRNEISRTISQKTGVSDVNLNDIINEAKRIKQEESETKRSVSGMTKLLLPQIIKDFPEFNENYLYNKTEDSLRVIFNSLNSLDTSNLNKVPLLKDSLESKIQDYKLNGIKVKYSDIKFHDFAIKEYTKTDGVATVTVCTTLEYYYTKEQNGVSKSDDKYKKQTRYACNFIYIYDESKIKGGSSKVFGMNCPNCGAAIRVLGHKYCEYCGTQINEVNLKAWEFSSYNEY